MVFAPAARPGGEGTELGLSRIRQGFSSIAAGADLGRRGLGERSMAILAMRPMGVSPMGLCNIPLAKEPVKVQF